MKRAEYTWKCRNRTILLGRRTLVMGILNVTPDSFSDGGRFADPDIAAEHALEMIAQGADIIDIGGESTRPGAEPVSVADEIQRTLPVIERIRAHSNIPISIDTMKAEVAVAAITAGADIINDVSAFEADERMVEVAAETGAGVILMHMRGTPRTMQHDPAYEDVVAEVSDYLKQRADHIIARGVRRESVVLDPGIGFGKTEEHNVELLRQLPALARCGFPVLVGASRKRFIGSITGRSLPAERRAGSLAVAAWSAANGTHILRVHDVIDTCDVCRMLDRFVSGGLNAMD